MNVNLAKPAVLMYLYTCGSHEEARRRWDEDGVDGHHVVPQTSSSSSSIGGQSHVVVVAVPVGHIRMSSHEGILFSAVVWSSHGVCGVWRPLVVVHWGHLDKWHCNWVEMWPRCDWLGLVDV